MNFFEDHLGNKSSSRLFAAGIIIAALLLCEQVMLSTGDILAKASAAGVLFSTIAGPAMVFLWAQKRTEVQQTGPIEQQQQNNKI